MRDNELSKMDNVEQLQWTLVLQYYKALTFALTATFPLINKNLPVLRLISAELIPSLTI